MRKKSFLLVALLCLYLGSFAQDVFTYLADFRNVAIYGFADSAGNTKTPGRYNLIMKPVEGVCRVWAGQQNSSDYASIRYGFCFPNGTELVPPIYNKAEDFSEGMAQVAEGGVMTAYRYGFINKKGIVQIPLIYAGTKPFSSGLAAVSTEAKKWQYIDKNGTVKIAGPFLDADAFSEGLAGVSVPYDMGSGVMSFKKGYIDTTGKMVIAPAYNYVLPFKNGFAIASVSESVNNVYKNYQVLIDKTGKRISKEEFITIYHIPSDGLYPVKISGSSGLNSDKDVWGVIDTKGVLYPARFKYQPYFAEGLSSFLKDGLYGFMDKTGAIVVPPIYKQVNAFSEGLAPVQLTTGEWGYINKKGQVVIKPEYRGVSGFRDGFSSVSKEAGGGDKTMLTGIIDKTGKMVVPLAKTSIGSISKGRAIAETNYISYYLYTNGKTSLACDVETLSNGRYALDALAKNDAKTALDLLNKTADKNCALTDYLQGYLYLQLKPPYRDTIRGAKLMEQAAMKNYPEAQYNLGYMYANGNGIAKDEAKAKQWLTKAAGNGLNSSYVVLGMMEEKTNPSQAFAYYQKATDLGDAVAMYYLALLYRDGRGTAKNEYQFNTWLNHSARRGFTPAQQLMNAKAKK